MNRIKSYIYSMIKSLHSRAFYSELIRSINIYGFSYVFFIALILSIPAAFQVRYLLDSVIVREASMFHQATGNEIENEINYISKQVPELLFKKSKFNTKNNIPTYIKSSNGETIFIIDTKHNIKDLSSFRSTTLLRDTEMLIVTNGEISGSINSTDLYQSFQNYFLPNSDNVLKFNNTDFFRDFYTIITTPYPVIFIFCFIWLGLRYFFKAILYSFIVGLFFSIMIKNHRFDFKQCVRIAAFTSTPIAILEFISFSLGQTLFAYPNLVYFTTHLIYIYFAVESFKRTLGTVK